jgi:hypothetical protein
MRPRIALRSDLEREPGTKAVRTALLRACERCRSNAWCSPASQPALLLLLAKAICMPNVLSPSEQPKHDPVTYPSDPDEPVWNYTQGTELRDPSGKELADYCARLVSWYTRGGFVDEYGKRHESGHHYQVDWGEVLNEPDIEHRIGPKKYTQIYDAIVTAIRRYVESIRRRLLPKTAAMINEVGAISADDREQTQPRHVAKPIPNSYWNQCGAMYAYLFSELANMGIETVNASQLVGYPRQYPSVSLVDWETGQPNARFWVLKLLKDHFGPGDKLVRTSQPGPTVYAQAFLSRGNKRRLLLVNRCNRNIGVTVPGAAGATIRFVDQTTGFQPPSSTTQKQEVVPLGGYSVAVVEFSEADAHVAHALSVPSPHSCGLLVLQFCRPRHQQLRLLRHTRARMRSRVALRSDLDGEPRTKAVRTALLRACERRRSNEWGSPSYVECSWAHG